MPANLALWYSGLAPSTLAQWIAAVGTICAVIVALFKDSLLYLWRKPKLVTTCENSPPWTVRTPLFIRDAAGTLLWTGDSYWVRVKVTNEGRTRAEKVQVSLLNLEYKPPTVDGALSEDQRQHFPLNLMWSHVHVPILDGISPGMSALCDIIAMSDPANPHWPRPADTPAGVTVGRLQLEVELPPEFHSLNPGSWRLTLSIAAANAKPTVKTLLFSHTGQWRQNDADMRRDCLRVSLE
jgi:hypothetical protein